MAKTKIDLENNPIAIAVRPMKEAAIKTAARYAKDYIKSVLEDLEAHGWDLNVCAPYPPYNEYGKEAEFKRAKHNSYANLTECANNLKGPLLTKKSAAREKVYIDLCKKQAAATYEAYVAKLISKIGDVTKVEIEQVLDLWLLSVLRITKPDGAVQRWQTKMKWNCSKFGKVFAQYPTILLKG